MADKMRAYIDAKDIVEKEIQNIARKGELDDKCLEELDKLVDIAKDIDTIFAMNNYQEDDNGYSSRMYYPHYFDGDMMNGNSYGYNRYGNNRMSYTGGNSYRMNENTNGMNGMSNMNGMNGNGYSRTENLRMRLEEMMNNEASTEKEREALRNAINRL